MNPVFIHGVPDTSRVWASVRARLGDLAGIALSLPGFGCPIPPGFTATKEEYVAWIVAELEGQPGPVDLVAHDWGCILALRVASLRPDLVRSWAAGSGPVSRDYEWHELAKIWQSPDGERWMAELNPTELASTMIGQGVPPDSAHKVVGRMDPLMKDCILRLYRSAPEVGREWEDDLANVKAGGLVLWGELDQACPVRFADRLGRDAHAGRVLKFEDCGHWWPLQRPDETAQALREHWRTAS